MATKKSSSKSERSPAAGKKRAGAGAKKKAAAGHGSSPGKKAPAKGKRTPRPRATGTKASSTPQAPRNTPPIEKEFFPDDWNNTEKLILARRSTRAYLKKQVPEQMIRRILECGRYAPSEGNYQPWRFIVVRDREMIEEMERDVKKTITTLWNVINYRDHPWKKYHTKVLEFLTPNNLHPIPSGASRGVAEGIFDVFWGAPTVIFILKDKRGIGNPDLDVGITGTNMVLAAHSMGLGTCWIGIASALMVHRKWRRLLNIRHPWYLEQGLLLGYPVGDPDGFVHRDTHYIDWFEDGGHKRVL